MPSNDNHSTGAGPGLHSADAHGIAALVLVESLLYELYDNSTLTLDQAIEAVDRAIDVQQDLVEAADGAGGPMRRAHELLRAIGTSLRAEGGGISSMAKSDGKTGDGAGKRGPLATPTGKSDGL